MKIVLAALVVGPLVLAGAAQAEVPLSNPSLVSSSALHLVAAANQADRKTYVRKKDAQMEEWRSKIGHFAERTQANATAAGDAASHEIQGAWSHVEQASATLDAVGEDGWDNAKEAFEQASHDLEATWARVGRSKN
jgi:hypothetical protein